MWFFGVLAYSTYLAAIILYWYRTGYFPLVFPGMDKGKPANKLESFLVIFSMISFLIFMFGKYKNFN